MEKHAWLYYFIFRFLKSGIDVFISKGQSILLFHRGANTRLVKV